MQLNNSILKRFAALRDSLRGELHWDKAHKFLYASDASIYQQSPLAVATPAHKQDCLKILTFCREHNIPLIPRAAGTSLAGQVVGEALIVDVSRHMNKIIHIDAENQRATVEPGVILESLNSAVKAQGLQFAPDPSTLNRCTIAGVIGNNAWGAHAPVYGSTREHIISTEVALVSGDVISMADCNQAEFNKKKQQQNREGDLYRQLDTIVSTNYALIKQRFPTSQDIICNAGYALHALADCLPWNANGPALNLSRLVCGSEGTLGLVTQAMVKLVPRRNQSAIVGVHFDSVAQALESVATALQHGASAVELLDRYLLRLTAHNLAQAKHRFWIDDNAEAVLLIEIVDDSTAAIEQRLQELLSDFRRKQLGYHFPVLQGVATQSAWSIRRAALGLLMGMTGDNKAVSFIEDSAVPVQHLPQFVTQVQQIMQQHNTQCVYYGSVSKGLIHLRPMLNLHSSEHREKFKILAQEVAHLLQQYDGTISAKHGDGIVRSAFIEQFFGSELTQAFQQVKSLFDPDNLLNPHKIVNPGAIDNNIRYKQKHLLFSDTGFTWPSGDLLTAVEQCNGAGACRKLAGNGTMCPSYMATLDEQHSTRGRANTIRQVLQQFPALQSDALQLLNDSLELCLACKGCLSECPANVDMARIKAECLHQTHKISGVPLRSKLIANLDKILMASSIAPGVFSAAMNSSLGKSLMGFHQQRSLPKLAQQPLTQWFNNIKPQKQEPHSGRVVIFNDVFTNYYEPNVGHAAVLTLEHCGYEVTLSPCFASLRSLISSGLLDRAKKQLITIVNWLDNDAESADYIVGLEPSELLALRDDALALNIDQTTTDRLQQLLCRLYLFEEFMQKSRNEITKLNAFNQQPASVLLHVHCHQKSLSSVDACVDTLTLLPQTQIDALPTGCCGMAGTFGYEKQHYQLSKDIASLVLLPALKNKSADTIIVATGASCRQQIRSLANVPVCHSAEVLYAHLIN